MADVLITLRCNLVKASDLPSSFPAREFGAKICVRIAASLLTAVCVLSLGVIGCGSGPSETERAPNPTSTLAVAPTTLAFGSVTIGSPATQTVTLTSTGTAAVTIDAATIAGSGFSLAGASLPATLAPNQTLTLSVQFNPGAAGAATGTLTITSTATNNPTATVNLSGTGVAVQHEVDLSWNAPVTSTDPVAGYHVYRAPGGSSSFQLLNSTVNTVTTYADKTVQSGSAYTYFVKSVDGSGVESVASNQVSVTIP